MSTGDQHEWRQPDWVAYGFSESERAMLVEVPPRSSDEWPLQRLLARWMSWVAEVDRGELLGRDEFESVCWCRDDLEELLPLLTEPLRRPVLALVDSLDGQFADATVPSIMWTDRQAGGPRWWWGRIPRRNAPRLFLAKDDLG